MGTVVIGMDPHKRSATIEVMAADERVLGGGRYGTDAAGYAAMLAPVPDRPGEPQPVARQAATEAGSGQPFQPGTRRLPPGLGSI
jgi:hypothetical protein